MSVPQSTYEDGRIDWNVHSRADTGDHHRSDEETVCVWIALLYLPLEMSPKSETQEIFHAFDHTQLHPFTVE
jgi:hypothetical protein